jgi:uncharacterized membrane protein
MRKILEFIAALTMAYLLLITFTSMYGDMRLPEEIPTHFDGAGNPNAWGTSLLILILPSVALLVYLGMTAVGRNAAAFNYPFRVTPANRGRLEAMTLTMISALKLETIALMALLQFETIKAARIHHLSLAPWVVPIGIGLIFATIFSCFLAMRKMGARTKPGLRGGAA